VTIKESSQAHLTLVHVFHVIPRWASVGGPHTIPDTPWRYGGVSSTLISLLDPINPYVPVHNQCVITRAQPTQSLIDTGGGYHLRSFEHENRPLPDLHIWYSTLSPSCPTQSRIVPHSGSKRLNHIGPLSEERALS
jgi:hypothetical protein